MKKHIVVIGGGMAGTAAAYHLRKKGYSVTILEKNNRLGGRIHSLLMGGVIVELGAGFFTNIYFNLLSFISETGLSKQMFTQRSTSGIFKKDTFFSPAALFFSLSFGSKVLFSKLFLSVFLLWFRINTKNPGTIKQYDTRSVADMFRKRKDKQVLEYIFQPILNGYCFWTPEQTSQAMLLVLAKFLLRGGRYRLKKGLQQIPETAAKGCNVFFHCEVSKLTREKKHLLVTFKNQAKLQTIKADGVVCATTATTVPNIFPQLSRRQKQFFSSVAYSSTIVTAQILSQQKLVEDIALAFPRTEGKDIATMTCARDKSKTNPFLYATKSYLPGKKFMTQKDDAIEKTVAKDSAFFRKTFLHDAQLRQTHIHRWQEAIPVFQKGSMNRFTTLVNDIEDTKTPVVFAGDYLTGPCIEWAFISGKLAAERLDICLNQ
jgi:oxygen-dependent protoporphyrinogen oxidase